MRGTGGKNVIAGLRGVGFEYDSQRGRILKGLDFDIEEGSATVVLGPNGVGKTTLLHLILGWLNPLEGDVELMGKPLAEYSQREKGKIMSLVPQKEHIPFEYSLIEYVLLGRVPYMHPLQRPKKVDYDIAAESIEVVGLDPADTRPIPHLSGGERQLLLIARSITQQPKLLLLDEPTSHLDLHNKKAVVELLLKLVAQGISIVLTTHEPEIAVAVGGSGILMKAGKVLASGPLEEIFTSGLLTETYDSKIDVKKISNRLTAFWL